MKHDSQLQSGAAVRSSDLVRRWKLNMKTTTVMSMMGEEARRVRKTVKMSVREMAKVCEGIAKDCRTRAEARKKVEEWWQS